MKEICQVCFNPNHIPLRFITKDISICKWCITEISKSNLSPNHIIEVKRQSIKSNFELEITKRIQHLKSLQPFLPELPSFDNAIRLAKQSVLNDESMLQFLYREFIENAERDGEIAIEAKKIYDSQLADYHRKINHYHTQAQTIKSQLSEAKSKMDIVAEKTESSLESYLNEIKKNQQTTNKDIRLLRAYFLNLINNENVTTPRPEGFEYDILKSEIRKRDNNKCVSCSRGYQHGELHVHHIIPLSSSGTNASANLVTLCHPCHNKQHDFKVTKSYPSRRVKKTQNTNFIAVDIETTGFSHENDSIIELAAVKFVNGVAMECFSSFVYSKKPVPLKITELTGITQSMVTSAPHPKKVMVDFIGFVQNETLVMHHASFDKRFLLRYLNYYGLELNNQIVDTLSIARRKLPNLQNHKLVTLISHFELDYKNIHRAKNDATLTGYLYLALVSAKGLVKLANKSNKSNALEANHSYEFDDDINYEAPNLDATSMRQTSEFKGEKAIIKCIRCNASLRVPASKHIRVRCSICNCVFEALT